jgi:protein-disulfide isomerase
MTIRTVAALVAPLTATFFFACKKEAGPAQKDKPGASAGAKASGGGAAKADTASPPVAQIGATKISLAELDKGIAAELYELRREALEKRIAKEVVTAAAKRAGKDEKTFFRDAMAGKIQISDAELKKAYEDIKDKLEGAKFEEAKPLLEMQLKQERQGEAARALLEQLKKEAGVKVMLDAPRIKVDPKGPVKGPANAPVTIVEFSDFECPYCSRGRTVADKVLAAYPGKVRLVFRDYPLDFHTKAQKASEAGHCAHEQGKFWEMHDKMFDAQDKIDVADLKAAAKGLGLDASKFDECLDSGRMATRVKENLEAGQAAGVSGTPAFFVNGRLLSGAQPLERFKEIIDAELAAK